MAHGMSGVKGPVADEMPEVQCQLRRVVLQTSMPALSLSGFCCPLDMPAALSTIVGCRSTHQQRDGVCHLKAQNVGVHKVGCTLQ